MGMERKNEISMAQLSDAARAFLGEVRYGIAATIQEDGMPHQTVMWYDLRGDYIMMNTLVGRVKEKNLKRDPRISLCVEDELRYVTVTGRATLDYDHNTSQETIKFLATKYNGPETAERQMRDLFGKQSRVTIYMSIEDVDEHL
jgi:PPOX class probable F420-dependent enzyme